MNNKRFYTIPANAPFLDELATMLLSQHQDNPLELAQSVVLLPSRRACRNLHEAFLRVSNGKALLLPRVLPIGEIEGEADIAGIAPIPAIPVMPPKKRLGILTRLIREAEKTTTARAYDLAIELAKLMDDVTRYNATFDRLDALVPAELARHWQKTTEFLAIIARAWPAILESEAMMDHATMQRDMVLALAKYWLQNPPDFPVIAAGSTGSIPATADLLIAISQLPTGMVILPGLDQTMSEDAWNVIEPTHPQFIMKQLLHKAEIMREEVSIMAATSSNHALSTVFLPATLTAEWRNVELNLKELSHLSFAESSTQQDEARMIAYLLRESLETPSHTAALITPDRNLARMVAAECARYNITIDDSAGKQLSSTAPAIFMRLILDVVENGFTPNNLLALLRHPLASLGLGTAKCRELSRQLELILLRDVRLESGMDALITTAKQKALSSELLAFLSQLRDALRPLEMMFLQPGAYTLSELIDAHCHAAEAIASTETLWEKDAGNALADMLAEWKTAGDTLGSIAARDYPSLFAALIEREVVRQQFGTHPRLHILSPIEARLLHFDTIILGEMNEGTWPASISPDPWMSAPMREQFGLPPHAMQIGQSVHDIWMAMHGRNVILTRARKIFGKPQEPSRWWVRLTTFAKGKDENFYVCMNRSALLQAAIEQQDAPMELPTPTQPKPKPPATARPTRFRATDIDRWRRDPYAFYAGRILRLNALSPLDQEPDASDFGQHIHRALELFSAQFPDHLPEHSYQLLMQIGETIFNDYANRPAVRNLWWPRFEAIAKHWLIHEKKLRIDATFQIQSEVSAEWNFEVAGKDVTLVARADRVDNLGSSFRLVDYKTGALPSDEALQLQLTALALLRAGKMNGHAESLEYWALKTRGSDIAAIDAPDTAIAQAEEILRAMIEASLKAASDYAPAQNSKDAIKDYEHLARRDEWQSS